MSRPKPSPYAIGQAAVACPLCGQWINTEVVLSTISISPNGWLDVTFFPARLEHACPTKKEKPHG